LPGARRIAGGSATVAQADLAVAVVMCIVQLAAVAFIFAGRPDRLVRLLPVLVRTAAPTEPSADP
jgi:hypothetical protein